MSQENSEVGGQAGIAKVLFRFPLFQKINGILWLMQLDAQFIVNKITADTSKFYNDVSSLMSETLLAVHDNNNMMLSLPQEKLY